jgi:uncharacterized protein
MILGVMSDTHGNSRLMHDAAQTLTGDLRAELLFHLGDDYIDSEELILAGYAVRRVPGLWCPQYQDARIPKRFVETFDGLQVAWAHAEKDLRFPERAAAIILTGHTHQADIVLLGHSLYVNPGHLKAPICQDIPASYGLIEIGPAEVHAAIYDAGTHRLRLQTTVPRQRLA